MRLRDEKQKTGHLLSFTSTKESKENFSFFFPVKNLDQFDSLLEVTNGFEKCTKEHFPDYEFTGYSIPDLGKVDADFQELNTGRISIFEQEEFLAEDLGFLKDFARIVIDRHIEKSKPLFPEIVIGALVSGGDFYDRKDKIETIWNVLEKGENFLLRAPRRYGKSSMLKFMMDNPRKGWRVCYTDLEGGKSSEDFVEYILKKGVFRQDECIKCLPDHLSELDIPNKSEMEKLEIIREERRKIISDWKTYAKELFDAIERKSGEDNYLLILDEISFLIEDMIDSRESGLEAVRDLLKWFNEKRKTYKKIRFIVSGSEHLPSFLSAYRIDGQLDSLKEETLDLFDKTTAREYIFLVLAGRKIVARKEEIDFIMELLGNPIPYFLQLFLDVVISNCNKRQSITIKDMEEIYYKELLGPDRKRNFESIVRQLDRYKRYGELSGRGAERLLDETAINKRPSLEKLKAIWQEVTGSEKNFEVMVGIIQDDFYIKQHVDDTLSFNSKLLLDWWNIHGLSTVK